MECIYLVHVVHACTQICVTILTEIGLLILNNNNYDKEQQQTIQLYIHNTKLEANKHTHLGEGGPPSPGKNPAEKPQSEGKNCWENPTENKPA